LFGEKGDSIHYWLMKKITDLFLVCKQLFNAVIIALKIIYHDIVIHLAGYIAYMAFLALFPFLLLVMLFAGLIGTNKAAKRALHEFYQILPNEIVKEISPIIADVVSNASGGIFFITLIFILWVSTSGIEAIRTGLNHVYDYKENRSVLFCRFQSLIFIFLGVVSFFVAVLTIVILPLFLMIWQFIEFYIPIIPDLPLDLGVFWNIIRIFFALIAMLIWSATCYKFLPRHQKITIHQCLPGAIIFSLLWVVMAALFSLYMQNIARYDVIYSSLGGIIATLLFFHVSSILLLFGGIVNNQFYKILNSHKL
jgi:membrane protein